MKKILAVAAIAGGLVIGGTATAHATESPYVTVAWSYAGYPDITAPQPFIASVAGADIHAFDDLAASPAWCGTAIQVDVYQRTDKHGVSWEILKETGALLYAHDGGYLAYNAGVGTPYRVITPEENQCTTPTPEPSSSATPTSPEPSTPASGQPSSSSSPTPSGESAVTPSGHPSATPSTSPSTGGSPAPVATSTSTPSASPSPGGSTPTSPSTTKPRPSVGASSTPSPSSSPTATGTPSPQASATSSAPSSGSAPSSTTAPPSTAETRSYASPQGELAYTGFNPWIGIFFGSVLVVGGYAALMIGRRRG